MTESKRMEKVYHTNNNPNRAGMATLISDKTDFKTKTVTRDKEEQFIIKQDQFIRR